MEALLNQIFGKAEKGTHLRLSAEEVQQLKQFIIELTAQNSELALRLGEMAGWVEPDTEVWTPFE